jgi:hypothetical protein
VRILESQNLWEIPTLATIRRAYRVSARRFIDFPTKLFDECTGRGPIGKAPPKIHFIFLNTVPSASRLNLSRPVKVYNPAVQFGIRFVRTDGKLDDIWVFDLVRQRLTCTRFAHILIDRSNPGHRIDLPQCRSLRIKHLDPATERVVAGTI